MEDKTIPISDIVLSLKRTELILEEMLWRQILHKNNDEIKSKDEFDRAMGKVSSRMKEYVQYLSPAK
ncbi:MAG: hypothetical protein JJE22_09760 [Bacteroidia bacterium]|nr:hypothetical protein [Bacteroidia bacterium]